MTCPLNGLYLRVSTRETSQAARKNFVEYAAEKKTFPKGEQLHRYENMKADLPIFVVQGFGR